MSPNGGTSWSSGPESKTPDNAAASSHGNPSNSKKVVKISLRDRVTAKLSRFFKKYSKHNYKTHSDHAQPHPQPSLELRVKAIVPNVAFPTLTMEPKLHRWERIAIASTEGITEHRSGAPTYRPYAGFLPLGAILEILSINLNQFPDPLAWIHYATCIAYKGVVDHLVYVREDNPAIKRMREVVDVAGDMKGRLDAKMIHLAEGKPVVLRCCCCRLAGRVAVRDMSDIRCEGDGCRHHLCLACLYTWRDEDDIIMCEVAVQERRMEQRARGEPEPGVIPSW